MVLINYRRFVEGTAHITDYLNDKLSHYSYFNTLKTTCYGKNAICLFIYALALSTTFQVFYL